MCCGCTERSSLSVWREAFTTWLRLCGACVSVITAVHSCLAFSVCTDLGKNILRSPHRETIWEETHWVVNRSSLAGRLRKVCSVFVLFILYCWSDFEGGRHLSYSETTRGITWTGRVALMGSWVADGVCREDSGPKHNAAMDPEKLGSSKDMDFVSQWH